VDYIFGPTCIYDRSNLANYTRSANNLGVRISALVARFYAQFTSLHVVMFRLGLGSAQRAEDDQQGGQQLQRGSSSAVHAQLHLLAGLRLVQLPSFWQDANTDLTQ